MLKSFWTSHLQMMNWLEICLYVLSILTMVSLKLKTITMSNVNFFGIQIENCQHIRLDSISQEVSIAKGIDIRFALILQVHQDLSSCGFRWCGLHLSIGLMPKLDLKTRTNLMMHPLLWASKGNRVGFRRLSRNIMIRGVRILAPFYSLLSQWGNKY